MLPADTDIEKKLDEGLALLRVLRPPRRRIAVVLDGGGQRLLRSEDIVYFTTVDDGAGKDRRLLVCTADGQQHYNFKGLADAEALLKDDPRFLRVHKSFLVNMEHVTTIAVVDGGRELAFDVLPELRIKVTNVADVEAYFGL